MNKVDLSIVIVNYKTPGLTDICVGSIFEFTKDISYEVIVVDNDSKDESEKLITGKYPEVKWVNMSENAGTSRAYNRGVRESSGDYILILNSDTELFDNAFAVSLFKYKELEKTMKLGLFACQLKGYDDIIQYNSNLEFPTIKKYIKANPLYVIANRSKKAPGDFKMILHHTDHETKWIGIAFGLVNAKIFRNSNLFFDEDIFMYSDEVEWCYRLIKNGYINYFSTCATILHLNGGSSVFSEWKHGQIMLSEFLFFRKIHGQLYTAFCFLLIKFNFLFDTMLYAKQVLSGKLIATDVAEKKTRVLNNRLINKYWHIVLFKFRKKTSSSKNYLKYVPQKTS